MSYDFCMQVFLTEGYLGIVMEYVNGGDMADLVDTWNARNRRRRPPPGTVSAGTQCASKAQKPCACPMAACTSMCTGCLVISEPPAVEAGCMLTGCHHALEQHSRSIGSKN